LKPFGLKFFCLNYPEMPASRIAGAMIALATRLHR
jgi:hypothetical protein